MQAIKKGYHSKHARKKEERTPRQTTHRYKKRVIWFSLRYARRFGGGNGSPTEHVRPAGPRPPTLGPFTRSMNSHECVYTFMEGNKQWDIMHVDSYIYIYLYVCIMYTQVAVDVSHIPHKWKETGKSKWEKEKWKKDNLRVPFTLLHLQRITRFDNPDYSFPVSPLQECSWTFKNECKTFKWLGSFLDHCSYGRNGEPCGAFLMQERLAWLASHWQITTTLKKRESPEAVSDDSFERSTDHWTQQQTCCEMRT